ncbi:glycoside hydrolase family 3 N-terminal domain-containing protein [Demequina gelatinilytica]|uniref:beta-xylosidase/alpha-l-arabinosidase n=1 Tax=Demequina gelatinilytica TaxID=1638980 RepID=UPI000782FD9E|nr:glycoside hydrolase family 3 N-terminal domain-containing protein [Demequina gelatinilytica]
MTAVDAAVSTRVAALVADMTLEEKLAQITGFWEDEKGDVVAPLQGEVSVTGGLDEATRAGLGHFTRIYGTTPVDADARARVLWERQRALVTGTRLGIPAIVHEEILTGLSAWKAATYPGPLTWGAAFDPALVARMGALIGRDCRALGIHQGLAPVLDVVRDPRWGRVEECIGEDPYLVGEIGTSYVEGVQSEGVHATLKHFVGYSASTAGRNFGPVAMGPRELRDVMLVPFEMAVIDGGVRSVMHAYTEIDGVPTAADPTLLTDVLRGQWGFDGVVVADYFGVAFLHLLHGIAGDLEEAAALALAAGVDVELPTGDAYLEPLAAAVRSGAVDEALVDRAVTRILDQKERLGLLDEDFGGPPPAGVVLDGPEHREVARLLAERGIVLLANDGTLPLGRPDDAAGPTPASSGADGPGAPRIAVIGPNADRYQAMFGCYSFANHVLDKRPGTELALDVPTVLDAVRDELGPVLSAQGCDVQGSSREGFAEAVSAARASDVAIVVVGDQAGLFGRGTSGEGCDTDSLELPGVQRELVEAVLETGTPVVLVLVTGRPYAVAWALERCAAVVQAFFPGEEGARAIAGVLSGRVNPSGRLPVSLPRSTGAQPAGYLHPRLGDDSDVTNLSSVAPMTFGEGLSYTSFDYAGLEAADAPTDGAIRVTVTVANTGDLAGDEVVQVYAHQRRGSVTRPVAQLIGFARVPLPPGGSRRVTFEIPAARLAFSGRDLVRAVEPGEVELWVGTPRHRSVEDVVSLTGARCPVDRASARRVRVAIEGV